MSKKIQVTFRMIAPICVKTFTQEEIGLYGRDIEDRDLVEEFIGLYHTPDGYDVLSIITMDTDLELKTGDTVLLKNTWLPDGKYAVGEEVGSHS